MRHFFHASTLRRFFDPLKTYALYNTLFQDIVEEGTKPRFITDGLSRFDLDQGKLGKCLLLNNQLYAKIGSLINDYDSDAIQ